MENTPKQRKQMFANFADRIPSLLPDLQNSTSKYFRQLMKIIEQSMASVIVPAILDHDPTSSDSIHRMAQTPPKGAPKGGPAAFPNLKNGATKKNHARHAMESLIQHLQHVLDVLCKWSKDWPVMELVFKQILHWIAIRPLNMLFVQKEACNYQRAIHLK